MGSHRIVFLPSGAAITVKEGTSIREAALTAGEEIETICGGKGTCGKCRVQIVEGESNGVNSCMKNVSPLTPAEQHFAELYGLAPDERLACQGQVAGNLAVYIPQESRVIRHQIIKNAIGREVEIKPSIVKYHVKSSSGSGLPQIISDIEKQFSLHNLVLSDQAEMDFASMLSGNPEGVTLTVRDSREIIRLEPGRSEGTYGLALDIGTTTVAGYLCDLRTGDILTTEAMLNPQVRFGEDIMARIAYAKDNPAGLIEMNQVIISAVNELVQTITTRLDLGPSDIVDVVMVGNTVMHHIFLGMDIVPLGMYPFIPVTTDSVNRKARDLGMEVLLSANIHALPIEAAFIGADNVGVMLAEEPHRQDGTVLIIDAGTNGELILGNRDRMLSASCATGPAFEGGNILFGMRAAPGTIDRVRIDPQTYHVSFGIIGRSRWSAELAASEIQVRGICGSGIIDAVAEMLNSGIIRTDGGFEKTIACERLRTGADGKPEFVIAWKNQTAIDRDIVIVQKDIRSIQLAMAAIATGNRMMLKRMGIETPDKVILAGAFGSFIDPRSALKLGMFPDCGLENVESVGNAAGDGARIALVNKDKREEAQRIAREVEYIELTEEPGFNEAFLEATHFPG